MADLVQFLLDQIDLDEVDANEDHYLGCDYPGPCTCAGLRPYSRQTPERVLAECAAKRRLAELHSDDEELGAHECPESVRRHPADRGTGFELPCLTLRLLAAPYVGHPDFDPDWLQP